MDIYIDAILCGLTVILELLGVFGLMMLIQLISYQVFGINLYRKINKGLNRLDRYLNAKFN